MGPQLGLGARLGLGSRLGLGLARPPEGWPPARRCLPRSCRAHAVAEAGALWKVREEEWCGAGGGLWWGGGVVG